MRGAQVCEARVGFVAGEGLEVCDGLAEEVVAEGFAEEVFARHGAVGGCWVGGVRDGEVEVVRWFVCVVCLTGRRGVWGW